MQAVRLVVVWCPQCPPHSPYVELRCIFPDVPDDFPTFRAILRGLSRTETLVWCARINQILSNPLNSDECGKQRLLVEQFRFFDSQEIERLNLFMRQYPNAKVFFREQVLELMRWTSLLSEDHADDGRTFENPDTLRLFAQAALMSVGYWGRRVYRDGFRLTGRPLEDRRRTMPMMRYGITTTATDILRSFHRGESFSTSFPQNYPEPRNRLSRRYWHVDPTVRTLSSNFEYAWESRYTTHKLALRDVRD